LKKHVNANHSIIGKKFDKKINNEIIKSVERQLAKKRPNVLASAISIFLM
jgi:hypothetical protein